jgi:hypothetical protein
VLTGPAGNVPAGPFLCASEETDGGVQATHSPVQFLDYPGNARSAFYRTGTWSYSQRSENGDVTVDAGRVLGEFVGMSEQELAATWRAETLTVEIADLSPDLAVSR